MAETVMRRTLALAVLVAVIGAARPARAYSVLSHEANVDAPKNHILVEFSFDVVQIAAGAYAPEAYHSFIGFEVATPLLERAFRETYGLEMKDLFLDEDLTIGTYRYAVSQAIPQMTRV